MRSPDWACNRRGPWASWWLPAGICRSPRAAQPGGWKASQTELTRLSYCAQPWQSFFPARSAIVEACENALDAVAK